MQLSLPCADAASVSQSIAFVVIEVLYPQLLERLQTQGIASADARAFLSSPACPLLALSFVLNGFEMDDPWDLSRVFSLDEFHCRVLSEESLSEAISHVLQESIDEAQTSSRFVVETRRHCYLQLRLEVSIARNL